MWASRHCMPSADHQPGWRSRWLLGVLSQARSKSRREHLVALELIGSSHEVRLQPKTRYLEHDWAMRKVARTQGPTALPCAAEACCGLEHVCLIIVGHGASCVPAVKCTLQLKGDSIAGLHIRCGLRGAGLSSRLAARRAHRLTTWGTGQNTPDPNYTCLPDTLPAWSPPPHECFVQPVSQAICWCAAAAPCTRSGSQVCWCRSRS